mmetsp:Transcript_33028/g.105215  ORF Transcript_33028/g.105215 Transcript_33028/m.105215 type:complete len:505 (-) Transcript_33028:2160-3674(-)
MDGFRSISPDDGLQRFVYLRELQARDHDLFHTLLGEFTEEILPYIYTPTVGEACQKYHALPIPQQGLYITADDAGSMLKKLRGWRNQGIRVVVVTDGERILGLGDLGAGGMGISEGKSLLYTVAAGVDPAHCLPMCLDVGTNNSKLLADPAYRGLRRRRVEGASYDALVAELVGALSAWRPHVLLQFEDFANHNAFRLLERYRTSHCCFNDDIQGTACITLAGLLAALRVTGGELPQQRVLFLGAGEAGTGIGELLALALVHRHGWTIQEARRVCFFLDSQGLVCKSRLGPRLQHHKRPFAHDVPFQRDLPSAVRSLRPTMLIGVSTIRGAFSREVVEAMCEVNERPVIFPLSNPTSQSECTFAEAHAWSRGRCVFASGSPFPPLAAGGVEVTPAQANNAYVFPAIGQAAILTRARSISDLAFLAAAEVLATISTDEELAGGRLFPRFSRIREVSVKVAAKVAGVMCEEGAGVPPPHGLAGGWEHEVREAMYHPGGSALVRAKL